MLKQPIAAFPSAAAIRGSILPGSRERHLRHLIKEFGEHYRTERHHQGIGSQIIRPKPSPSNDNATLGVVGCRSRLGGLLRYYSREAA